MPVPYNYADPQGLHLNPFSFNYMSSKISELQKYVYMYVKIWSETRVLFLNHTKVHVTRYC